MAATSAALKLGSVVKEVAICSTKTCGNLAESFLGSAFLESLLHRDFVKSRVTTAGAGELRDFEEGMEPTRLTLRPEPDVASI